MLSTRSSNSRAALPETPWRKLPTNSSLVLINIRFVFATPLKGKFNDCNADDRQSSEPHYHLAPRIEKNGISEPQAFLSLNEKCHYQCRDTNGQDNEIGTYGEICCDEQYAEDNPNFGQKNPVGYGCINIHSLLSPTKFSAKTRSDPITLAISVGMIIVFELSEEATSPMAAT